MLRNIFVGCLYKPKITKLVILSPDEWKINALGERNWDRVQSVDLLLTGWIRLRLGNYLPSFLFGFCDIQDGWFVSQKENFFFKMLTSIH